MKLMNGDPKRLDDAQYQTLVDVLQEIIDSDINQPTINEIRQAMSSPSPNVIIIIKNAVHFAVDQYGSLHFNIQIIKNQTAGHMIHIYVEPELVCEDGPVGVLYHKDNTTLLNLEPCYWKWNFTNVTI